MAASTKEVLNIWGRKLLTDRGHNVPSDAVISFELATEGEGCCDMCYSDYGVMVISYKTNTITVQYELEDILAKLVTVAREN